MAAPLARVRISSIAEAPAPPPGAAWTAQVMAAAARAMGRMVETGRCNPAAALDWLGRLEDAGRLMTLHAALTPWLSRCSGPTGWSRRLASAFQPTTTAKQLAETGHYPE